MMSYIFVEIFFSLATLKITTGFNFNNLQESG